MKIFDKENGDTLSCVLCGQIIVINASKYEEHVVEKLVHRHYSKCNKEKEVQDNEDIKF